ncbi:MAG: FAD-binding protein [Bacteroidetes bacterium]|nr:FAD-binding protein [Bacteroidota bacterium]
MIKPLLLRVPPITAHSDESLAEYIAEEMGIPKSEITGIRRIRQSIDARSREVMIQVQVEVFINEPFQQFKIQNSKFKNVSAANPVIIVGSGPAGIFAAFKLIEFGLKPIILERGKEVSERRRDIAALTKQRIVNPESNYCFGEGGAGTFSDGKLYTRSTKRGDIERILHLFVAHGAEERILYEAHPHIGTNKLPKITTAMRKTITEHGGEFHFNSKVSELIVENNICKGVKLSSGETVNAKAVLLATGHSARDIFFMLHRQNILIEAKPFALGVRIEHPQQLIDSIQYKCTLRGEYLPPASYSLVHQSQGKGVFSFCMCPGGIIAPAMTNPGEIVVNGWSPSRRNNPYANSGMVVSVEAHPLPLPLGGEKSPTPTLPIREGDSNTSPPQWGGFKRGLDEALSLLHFQQAVEQRAFVVGGGNLQAPAQRVTDFIAGKTSSTLPGNSYFIGTTSVNLRDVLPPDISRSLREGLIAFGKKMKGYVTEEGIMVATESRTSSPVRIPRDKETLQHPQVKGLYPCGEGAGYAGGIVSAAMDGERCADMIGSACLKP